MVDEFPQAQVPGEGSRQEQAGIATRRWSSKRMRDTVGIVLWRHHWALLAGRGSKTIIPDSEEHPIASSRAVPKAVLRWIRAKVNVFVHHSLEELGAAMEGRRCPPRDDLQQRNGR